MRGTWLCTGRFARPAAATMLALGWLTHVGGNSAEAKSTPAPHAPADEKEVASKSQGLELGQFQIRVFYPVEAQRGKITFTLHSTVAGGNPADAERSLEHRRNKVRDQVIVAARLAALSDFNDPALSSFRRRILLRLHRALPELPIENVFVSDFELAVDAL